MLALAAFGTLSLSLLLAAYLAWDLFAPLRQVEGALNDAALGDLERRLPEDRADEIGATNRAFNAMVMAIAQRERVNGLAALPIERSGGTTSEAQPRKRAHGYTTARAPGAI